MSDEGHHVESSDDGAPVTYPQQAGTIRKNGYISSSKGRPCKFPLTRSGSGSFLIRK
ncbi:unnamed protein product [Brassica oleracea]